MPGDDTQSVFVGILSRITSWFKGSAAQPVIPGEQRAGSWRQPGVVGSEELMRLYERNDELRRVIDLIAVRQASVQWKILKGATQVESDADPLVRCWKRPNPYMTMRSMLALIEKWSRLQDEFFIRVVVTESRDLELYPIPPNWVEVCATEEGDSYYRVRYPVSGTQAIYTADELLWCKIPCPRDPYGRAQGAGFAASDDAEKAEYAGKFTKAFFYNDATPGLVIHAPGMPKAHADTFRAQWTNSNQGVENAHGLHLTTGPADSKMIFHQLTPPLKDLTISDIEQRAGDAIRQLYGVPPELIGQLENSNRATIKEALAILSELVLLPRLNWLMEEFNERLLPMIEAQGLSMAGYSLAFVDPTPVDTKMQREMMKAHPHHFTRNEVRQAAGLPAVEGGDNMAITRGKVEVVEIGNVKDERSSFAPGQRVRIQVIQGGKAA